MSSATRMGDSVAKVGKRASAKGQRKAASSPEQAAKLAAIDKVQAVIEFAMDGTILFANQNFLDAVGYSLAEIQGKHHRMFVEPASARGVEYAGFWQRLCEGRFERGEFKRIGKNGREIWLQASYNPIVDARGKAFKVVKYATDVTQQKLADADAAGQIAAVNKSQAVIEFAMDGTIIHANPNFLNAMGYTLDEIKGHHHRLFVEREYAQSPAYREFWQRLNEGKYELAEYKRLAKGGREVWIQASYNPILDLNGKPFKVVKYASDVTSQNLQNADYSGQIAAIHKSQAVIEFALDGTIVDCNDNFLTATGYSRSELKGKHHSLLVDPAFVHSEAYRQFWKDLAAGQYQAGEFRRLGKGGREVWIQASYNPILDLNGRPFKVVKYATDITQQKQAYNQLTAVVEALARGDLTTSMQGNFKGDHAALQQKLNATVGTLANLVSQISSAIDTVSSAATDIAEGNSNLSTRTQEQSSSLEETASSLEQLTATVRQNASNATSANQLAAGARAAAEKGGSVVDAAVTAMGAITESSARVADIIGVIEQIAFQTNMLALNAAVEAARAGDQGRGFAVVAAEVRTLAQRSATAAKEVNALIRDSHEKVEQGAKLVNRSGATLSEIVSCVKKVSDIIGEIDSASEQQAAGIDQINTAVTHMDRNTQQNAAMVEQATAAAESLTEQARNMAELVRFFTLSGQLGDAPEQSWRSATHGNDRKERPTANDNSGRRRAVAAAPVRLASGDKEWK